jgi:membrane-associated phospholipid phosphatase
MFSTMKMQGLQILTFAGCVLLGVPTAVRSQDGIRADVGQSDLEDPTSPAAEPTETPAGPAAVSNRGQNTVPQVEHTGLATLARDTYHDFAAFPRRKSTWVILGLGGGLAALAHPIDKDVNAHLVSSSAADNLWKPGHIIGGPVMYALPAVMYLGGRYVLPKVNTDESQTNKWSHLGLDLTRAEILEEAIVEGLKVSVQRTRPNGSNYSFPSGHAAATFALAAVLERHLGYRLAWPTLALATYVATSRLHDNVHYLSDVIFGAAIGTAAGWTVVGRHGRTNYALEPLRVPGGFAFVMTRRSAGLN